MARNLKRSVTNLRRLKKKDYSTPEFKDQQQSAFKTSLNVGERTSKGMSLKKRDDHSTMFIAIKTTFILLI